MQEAIKSLNLEKVTIVKLRSYRVSIVRTSSSARVREYTQFTIEWL